MEQFDSMISFAGQKIKTQDKDLEVERHDAQFTLINLGVGERYSQIKSTGILVVNF